MEFKYVIGVKKKKDGRWIFATTDQYGMPRFCESYYEGRQFASVLSAERWFENNHSRIFGGYYSVDDVDLSTFTVREIVHQGVSKLEFSPSSSKSVINRLSLD